MINMFISNGTYLSLSLFFLFPTQTYLWVYPVWVHSQCGLEVFNQCSSFCRCKKALNRQNFSHMLGVALGFWLIVQVYGSSACLFAHPCTHLYVQLSICLSVCSYICHYICMSVVAFIYLSNINLYYTSISSSVVSLLPCQIAEILLWLIIIQVGHSLWMFVQTGQMTCLPSQGVLSVPLLEVLS